MESPFAPVPIFTGLNAEALELFASRAVRSVVPPGTAIVKEGELGNKLYVIDEGLVRVVKNVGTPGEAELAKMGKGDIFGEMCILETLPRAASVVALTETAVYAIPSTAFADLFEKLPKQHGILLLNMARDLSRRVRQLDKAVAARQ